MLVVVLSKNEVVLIIYLVIDDPVSNRRECLCKSRNGSYDTKVCLELFFCDNFF